MLICFIFSTILWDLFSCWCSRYVWHFDISANNNQLHWRRLYKLQGFQTIQQYISIIYYWVFNTNFFNMYWQKFHFIPVISLFLTVLSSLIGSAKGKK